MSEHELIKWAVQEIRELDELCRSMIPGYAPLDSNDMHKVKELEALAAHLENEQCKQP